MKILRVEFTNYLDLRNIQDKIYQLLDDFVTLVHSENKTIQITIKKGFVTDLASVPKIPFAYLLYGGIGHYPAVAHDGLYSNSELVEVIDLDTGLPYEYNRLWADTVFKLGLEERGITAFKYNPMYWGVRLKGGSYYKQFS